MILILAGILFYIYFNRDPERKIPSAANSIVAPADGKLLAISSDAKWHKLAIFMNLHNVHVQRIPIAGKVISVKKIVGGKLPAFAPDATHNNQVVIELQTKIGKVIVKQMSGLLVRRIKTFVKPGQLIIKGERLGRIMLGSRVELWLPANKTNITAKIKDNVKAGETIVAVFS
jgi:phosphatidylserine decarboxylase